MEVVEHAETGSTSTARTSLRLGPPLRSARSLRTAAPFSEKYKDHLYDGEIAYADSTIARWIAFLKKAGVYDTPSS